jgi:hypothetical protein
MNFRHGKVLMETLEGERYTVRSFLVQSMSSYVTAYHETGLPEYLEIFLLFTALLTRALGVDLAAQREYHTKSVYSYAHQLILTQTLLAQSLSSMPLRCQKCQDRFTATVMNIFRFYRR